MARRRNPLSVLYFIDERTCGESRLDLQVWKNGANDSTAGSARSIDFISLSPSCITGCQPVLRGNFEVYPSVCAAQKHVARQNQRLGLRTAPTTERCHLNANPAGYIWWLHAKSFPRQPISMNLPLASCPGGGPQSLQSNSNNGRFRIPECASAQPTALDPEIATPSQANIRKRSLSH